MKNNTTATEDLSLKVALNSSGLLKPEFRMDCTWCYQMRCANCNNGSITFYVNDEIKKITCNRCMGTVTYKESVQHLDPVIYKEHLEQHASYIDRRLSRINLIIKLNQG